MVMVKKHISKFVERISVQCDNVIVLKLSRTLFGTEDDSLYLSTYVPPPAAVLSTTQRTPTVILQKSKSVFVIFLRS